MRGALTSEELGEIRGWVPLLLRRTALGFAVRPADSQRVAVEDPALT
jgi:hypothetical protein